MGQKKETFSCPTYMNSVTIVGFVGADPEQRQARNNGSKFTVLSVATQRSWKNAEDEWVSKVEWHRVAIIWNPACTSI
jgi:single-stranded DNA-binding protein